MVMEWVQAFRWFGSCMGEGEEVQALAKENDERRQRYARKENQCMSKVVDDHGRGTSSVFPSVIASLLASSIANDVRVQLVLTANIVTVSNDTFIFRPSNAKKMYARRSLRSASRAYRKVTRTFVGPAKPFNSAIMKAINDCIPTC